MRISKALRSNLRFLVIEAESQLNRLLTFFDHRSESLARTINSRIGYANNLKLRIQDACMEQATRDPAVDKFSVQAISSIANELERLVELSAHCVQQLLPLGATHKIDLRVHKPFLRKVVKGIGQVEKAFLDKDTKIAIQLGRLETELNIAYQLLTKQYTVKLKKRKRTEELVTALFVANTIKQMGDILLNISESIISSSIGQPMELQRYSFLQDAIGSWAKAQSASNIAIKPVAETRSGSGISSINYQDEQKNEQLVIFKDGEKRKLKEEFQGVEKWHRLFPGVAPQILTYKKDGDSAALLIEHLHGITFEQIVLNGSPKIMKESMQALSNTLNAIWDSTKVKKKSQAGFIHQIHKRLNDVYAVHPEFRRSALHICRQKLPGFVDQLQMAEAIEKRYPAPFRVLIHGDFNIDNLIFDTRKSTIKFIDLHRSGYLDYVQDVSVFMVSNYRLQALDSPVRRRIRKQVEDFYAIARKFAEQQNDKSFEVRLGLGLTRSLITSTRFILDKSMATRMFLRARFILNQLLQLDDAGLETYRLPIKEIFCD